jgi:glycosyltransferase involved in cell wall biosynthesis
MNLEGSSSISEHLMNSTRSPASPLSVCYFSPGWPLDAYPNGVVSYVADLYAHLRAKGHEATILADGVAEGNHDPGVYDLHRARLSLSPAQRAMIGVWRRVAAHPANQYQYRRGLVDTFRRARAEHGIQLFEMEESFGWARWVSQASSVPVCIRLHGPWFLNSQAMGFPEDDAFRARVADEGRAIAEADIITAPSHDVLDRTRAYYGLDLDGALVIPPPTPPVAPESRWRLTACDPDLILFIGRFDRHKGGDIMIEAFSRVLQEVPRARLCFVGSDRGLLDGEGRAWRLEEFIRDRIPGAIESGTVILTGNQPFSKLEEWRRRAMVNVICSRYETISRVLIETMSMGCPLVVARAGGMIEAFEDQTDALSHRSEDPDDLASKIVTLLKNPPRAAELGRQAATSCERKFYPDVIVTRLIDFYRDVIERWRARDLASGRSPWRSGGTRY